MCRIVGCHPFLIRDRQSQSGGAQYLMRGVDFQFFDKMERDCERMYREVTDLNNKKKQLDPKHHELQIWCTDMWCLLWGAWMRGYDTHVSPALEFCWATDPLEKFEKNYIFHNAGVTKAGEGFFYKGLYTNSLPYQDERYPINPQSASSKYHELLMEVGKTSCLI
jgi:hypothetical protein